MPTVEVKCPECAAKAGEACMALRGKTVGQEMKKLHKSRYRAVAVKPESVEKDVDTGWKNNVKIREERTAQVRWAIHFARSVMRMSQEDIEDRLIEMIVDAELDLKLF